MNYAICFVLMAAVVCPSFLSAQTSGVGKAYAQSAPGAPRAEDTTAAIRALEEHIEEAMVRDDVAFMEKTFADDFTYARTTGESENKAQWLQTVARRPFISRKIVSLEIEVHGDVAITHGKLDMAVHDERGGHSNLIKYFHVYEQRNGNWVLLTHRSLEEMAKPLT
jgi:ketosteroid isomerase-like protein